MGPDLAVQKAIRARLVASAGVTALVPADSILDSHQRPAPRPAIVLGESTTHDAGTCILRRRTRVWHTLHIWVAEPSLEGAKGIAAAVVATLSAERLDLGASFRAVDSKVVSTRALRDPDGETSHGVVAVEVLAEEVTP